MEERRKSGTESSHREGKGIHERNTGARRTCSTNTCRKKWKKVRKKSHSFIKTWHLSWASKLALFSLIPHMSCIRKTRDKERRGESTNTSSGSPQGTWNMSCDSVGSWEHRVRQWVCLPMRKTSKFSPGR